MLRQGVCLLPVVWLMPYFLDNKPLAIWLSMPVSDIMCNLATIPPILMQITFLSKVKSRDEEALKI
jgi:Na+-driven multidrug efflux pump